MHKRLLASVLGALTLLLALFTATAYADSSPPGVQTGSQTAGSGQVAAAGSGATQVNPSNTNIAVRVLSPGDDGSVSQTNSVSSNANATNSNSANQSSTQNGGGIQVGGQTATNDQLAAALSTANQYGATNTNTPVRVLSDGDGGSVTQSNDATSNATSSNTNGATQSAGQNGSSCGCAPSPPIAPATTSTAAPTTPPQTGQSNAATSGAEATNGNAATQTAGQGGAPGAIQTSDQSAKNGQAALAASDATQVHPKNTNISVRVLSEGDDGDVTQSNTVDSHANSTNNNSTQQSSDQSQAGDGCGCSGSGIQTGTQSAKNKQLAGSLSEAKQVGAENKNIPVRVLSDGDGGSVTQSNHAHSDAKSTNDNQTMQDAGQSQAGGRDCGCADGPAIQTGDQSSGSEQAALSASGTFQGHAQNKNVPVRVKSEGDDGSVSQSNDATSNATAHNTNGTTQTAMQDIAGGGGGTAVQTSKQGAWNGQLAGAVSSTKQIGASNKNAPTRVDSEGDGGSVEQSNSASSNADSTNSNKTTQSATQDPHTLSRDCGCGSDIPRDHVPNHDCGCDGKAIQTADQSAKNLQVGLAKSDTAQVFGKSDCGCSSGGNSNAPTRVHSDGDDGYVEQSNDATSNASATNTNGTTQTLGQDLSGAGSGTGIQDAKQWAGNGQFALSGSAVWQAGARNDNAPTRVYSEGDGGMVSQSNTADSKATSSNDNTTKQEAKQDPHVATRECGCGSTGIQTAKQSAWNEQGALGLSLTKQLGASNKNAPTRVYSDGDDGYVTQSNEAKSEGTGTNKNATEQTLGQDIAGGGVGTGVQVAGQEAKSKQLAAGLSAAFQIGARNDNSPTRVYSEGDGGMVSQTNSASSTGTGTNGNSTMQHADQGLAGGSCGCGGVGVQALGQKAANEQIAAGLSATIQDFGRSECGCSKAGNSNSPSRVYSDGDDGYVSQANTASSTGTGTNTNAAMQDGHQGLGGGGIGVQALGQLALNGQFALGLSAAFQGWARNASNPTRVHSEGDGGSLSQSNDATSTGTGTNRNGATQDGTQDAPESLCGCEDTLVQALGQASKNGQAAAGLSKSDQLAPSNAAAPTAVWSPEADAIRKAPDKGSAQDALDRAKTELAARQDR